LFSLIHVDCHVSLQGFKLLGLGYFYFINSWNEETS